MNGGLSQLHSADEDAVSWLTSCGSRHAYEKKKKTTSNTVAQLSQKVCIFTVALYWMKCAAWNGVVGVIVVLVLCESMHFSQGRVFYLLGLPSQ